MQNDPTFAEGALRPSSSPHQTLRVSQRGLLQTWSESFPLDYIAEGGSLEILREVGLESRVPSADRQESSCARSPGGKDGNVHSLA